MRLLPMFLSAVFVVLAACSSAEQRQAAYDVIAPKDVVTGACIAGCLRMKASCEDSCGFGEKRCLLASLKQRGSGYSFASPNGSGGFISRVGYISSIPADCRVVPCTNSCDSSQRSCIVTCGGEIVVR